MLENFFFFSPSFDVDARGHCYCFVIKEKKKKKKKKQKDKNMYYQPLNQYIRFFFFYNTINITILNLMLSNIHSELNSKYITTTTITISF